MHPHAANYFMHGKPPGLTGNEHPNLVPYATFPTRTDDIFIGVGNDGTFRKLAKEIGKPELGTDPRFARNKDRIANRDALRAELAAVFSQHEAEPLCNRLLAAGLPAGPVQKIDQALTNAHTFIGAISSPRTGTRASPPRSGWSGPNRACAARRRNSASTRPRCWASSAIPRAKSRLWSPRARSAAPSASAEALSSRPIVPTRPGRWLMSSGPRQFFGFPWRTLPQYHAFAYTVICHVIHRCYRAKRR